MNATTLHLALIGDYNPDVIAHQAIPVALQRAAEALGLDIHIHWLDTDAITSTTDLYAFDGFWCVPASPYRNTDGALRAIQFARQQLRPFLGTCGGFQHAVLEFARHVLGWTDAEHGETSPEATRAVITPLSCALVEAVDTIELRDGSRIAAAYACQHIREGYRCRYGINPEFADALQTHGLRTTGHDADGDPRAIELQGHPFFVACLFQPERAALEGRLPPLVNAFVEACARNPR